MNPVNPLVELSETISNELGQSLLQLAHPEQAERAQALAERVQRQLEEAADLMDLDRPRPAAGLLRAALVPLYELTLLAVKSEADDRSVALCMDLDDGIDWVLHEEL